MSTPDPDPIARLLQAGFPLLDMTAEQREVLSGLSDEELTLLIDIKTRLDTVGSEVQAHGVSAGAGMF
jgi:hypothetical protein